MMTASSAPGSTPSHFHPGSAEPRGFSFSGSRARSFPSHVTRAVTAAVVDSEFKREPARRFFGCLLPSLGPDAGLPGAGQARGPEAA